MRAPREASLQWLLRIHIPLPWKGTKGVHYIAVTWYVEQVDSGI